MSICWSLRWMGVLGGLGASLALVGCGSVAIPLGSTSGSGSSSTGGTGLSGIVFGGQQPIVGADVYLYAAGTSAYGAGSTSLLNGSGTVRTDSNGKFAVGSGYTCPSASAQTYVVVVGGNTGSGVNPQSVLMSALGNCGDLGSTAIVVNEVSSVVSVYALAQFMSAGSTPGSVAIGTSSTNVTGLVNAFSTAANLIDPATGAARATTPAGNGTVPQNTINTLANIVASCVNTTPGAGACSSLFSAATPGGGTAPADTLSALLDVALNPGHNVQALYNVPAPKGSFQPSLTGAPHDWTLSVEFTGGGLQSPQLPAVDGVGNIWVPNAIDPGTLSEFSPTGVPLSPAVGFAGGGLSYPQAVAVDLAGDVWASNEGNGTVSEHTSGGTPLSGSGYTATGMRYPYAIALDAAGNVFTANGNNTVSKLSPTGTPVALFTGGGLDVPYALAVDTSQNVWVVNSGLSNSLSKFSNSGAAASVTGYVGGGMAGPVELALDASGNAWVANFDNASVSEINSAGTPLSGAGYVTPADVSAVAVDGSNTVWTANTDGSISRLANNGTAISPATGYISAGATGEVGIALDASGNVWTTDNFVNSIFEYVGAASPAVAPLQLAVKNNKLGQRP